MREVADDANGQGAIRIAYTTSGMGAAQLAYAYAPGEATSGSDVWLNAQLEDTLSRSSDKTAGRSAGPSRRPADGRATGNAE